MATLAAAAARQAATLGRIPTSRTSAQAANLIQRRGLAGAAGKSHFRFPFFIYLTPDLSHSVSESLNPFS